MSGYVRSHRKMMDSPGMQGNALRWGMFHWLLWQAAWKDTTTDINGKSVPIKRGQVCVSLRRMATETGTSLQVVRSFLATLENNSVVNTAATHGRTIITICNYGEYQSDRDEANTGVNTGPNTAATQQQHTKERREKGKKVSSEEDTAPARPKLTDFASAEQVAGFKASRKALRAPLTERAETLLCHSLEEIAAQGGDPGEALDMAVERGWKGIKPEWFFNAKRKEDSRNGRPNGGPGADPGFEARLARWDELDARTTGEIADPGAYRGDAWGGEEARWVDHPEGFGAVVPLFSAGGR